MDHIIVRVKMALKETVNIVKILTNVMNISILINYYVMELEFVLILLVILDVNV
jgi:hypothetical protein